MLANSAFQTIRIRSLSGNDFVDTNVIVCESCEEEVTILVPGKTGASNVLLHLLLFFINWSSFEVRHEFL